MTDPILSFSGVSKKYATLDGGGRYALRGVSFDVHRGECVAVVGRSGSGKSTLLHLAAGIDIPTEGTVSVQSQDLASFSERRRAQFRRDQVGFIFQLFHLLPHLSVAENVALPELIAGGRASHYRTRVHQLLNRVGLSARWNDPVQFLSGGEMQRVAICRALLRRPEFLLADEPTGSLDDFNGQKMMELMLEMVREERTTLIYVTHSKDVAALAQRKLLLHSGELEASGAES